MKLNIIIKYIKGFKKKEYSFDCNYDMRHVFFFDWI